MMKILAKSLFPNKTGTLCVDLDDNNNFDEDDPDIIIHLKPLT